MRKTIRLTGRRQLPITAFDFQIAEVQGKRMALLSLIDSSCLQGFAANAEIRVKIVENKLVEILRFGTIGKPTVTAELAGTSFLAPSCQIRVVANGGETEGVLLGSTKTGPTSQTVKSMEFYFSNRLKLHRVPGSSNCAKRNTQSFTSISRIPDAARWARTNPVFNACVLPHVIDTIFQHIFETGSKPEDRWMAEWVAWAGTLIPANPLPFVGESKEKRAWVDVLTETFAAKHKLADQLIAAIPKVH